MNTTALLKKLAVEKLLMALILFGVLRNSVRRLSSFAPLQDLKLLYVTILSKRICVRGRNNPLRLGPTNKEPQKYAGVLWRALNHSTIYIYTTAGRLTRSKLNIS